jgi:hypothetical protein
VVVEGSESGPRGRADGPEDRPLSERCITYGAPRTGTGYNSYVQLIQSPETVVILQEMIHDARLVPMNGTPHLPKGVRQLHGDPRGRWEGDTLVIESTNFNGKMWLDSVGNFVSENVRVVERLRLVEANTMDYEVTIDDPTVFTQPWTLSYRLRRAGTGGGGGGGGAAVPDPYAAESWEHACHEGNFQHIEGVQHLGFKWFDPVVPPGR